MSQATLISTFQIFLSFLSQDPQVIYMKRGCEASVDLTIATSSEDEDEDDDDASITLSLLVLTSAIRAVAYGLDARGWVLLCTWGASIAFFNTLYKLRQQFGTEADLGCLDAFAGVANI